jgi:hypothetical protein
MTVPLKFKFPISTLVQDGDYILKAAEARPEINTRLTAGHVAAMRTLHGSVKDKLPAQATAKSGSGQLTSAQEAAWKTAKKLVSKARETATNAFKGNSAKLHNEFQVGNSDASSLADFLQNARIIEASCKIPANAAAMAEWGWIASDTTALGAAIEALDTADDEQEDNKGEAPAITAARNKDANDLYTGLLKIQSAADLQYPEENPDNGPARIAFRLGLFPPKRGGKGGNHQTPPPAPPQ